MLGQCPVFWPCNKSGLSWNDSLGNVLNTVDFYFFIYIFLYSPIPIMGSFPWEETRIPLSFCSQFCSYFPPFRGIPLDTLCLSSFLEAGKFWVASYYHISCHIVYDLLFHLCSHFLSMALWPTLYMIAYDLNRCEFHFVCLLWGIPFKIKNYKIKRLVEETNNNRLPSYGNAATLI